jgi:hypothetical protein
MSESINNQSVEESKEPPQLSEYEAGRQQKQAYLIENVVHLGYDTTAFASYMERQKGIDLKF